MAEKQSDPSTAGGGAGSGGAGGAGGIGRAEEATAPGSPSRGPLLGNLARSTPSLTGLTSASTAILGGGSSSAGDTSSSSATGGGGTGGAHAASHASVAQAARRTLASTAPSTADNPSSSAVAAQHHPINTTTANVTASGSSNTHSTSSQRKATRRHQSALRQLTKSAAPADAVSPTLRGATSPASPVRAAAAAAGAGISSVGGGLTALTLGSRAVDSAASSSSVSSGNSGSETISSSIPPRSPARTALSSSSTHATAGVTAAGSNAMASSPMHRSASASAVESSSAAARSMSARDVSERDAGTREGYGSLRSRYAAGNISVPTSTTHDGGNPSNPASPSAEHDSGTTTSSLRSKHGWTTVETSLTGGTNSTIGGIPPCPRSLHAAAVCNGSLLVFGGYNGADRLNDFHSFDFAEGRWSPVLPSANSGPPPSPRDRHVAFVHGTSFYIFAGFDGTSRVNDFYGFDFSSMSWRQVLPATGGGAGGAGAGGAGDGGSSPPPSPRHSHSAVVYEDGAYIYAGYDGSYRSDFHCFDFNTRRWSAVTTTGRSPRARYRATTVVHLNTMILFGGHDGTRHLADTHIFNFDTGVWTAVLTEGTPPIPRDSHVAVVHFDSMYIFGGSTGSAMNDLLELQLPTSANPTARWRAIETPPSGTAGHRFCHVAVEFEDSLYVFGGYDGQQRLNDFIKFDFDIDDLTCEVPPSTLIADMKSLVDNDALSDISFVVEGVPIHAHKVMLMRCPYFAAMLLGPMMESSQSEIRIEQVSHPIFLLLLEYIYTDTVRIPRDAAMDLFAAANQFSLPRLQAMCEKKMLESITIGSAATIFLAADLHSAENLRAKSLKYILAHFEQVSKTDAFEEMARGNVELVFEILRNR